MKNHVITITLALFFYTVALSQSTNTLWYAKPAEHFEECFVMGNGKMGVSVFGGVFSEKIYLNDATLWSGEPVDARMNPEAHTHIPPVRDALEKGDYQLADQLMRKMQGSFSESFAPLGTMTIRFQHSGEAANYRRELDISSAISKINYSVKGVEFSREYFVSHPDKVFVIILKSSKKNALNFEIDFESLLNYKTGHDGNIMIASGYAPYHAEPSYRGDMPDAVLFDENRGTRFTAIFEIKNKGGKVTITESGLVLIGGTEAVVLVSVATSFNGFDKDPAKEGLDDKALAKDQLSKASLKSWSEIKKEHLADYRHFFDRVELDLGGTDAPDLPTGERLKRYADGGEDKNLEVLYFQFGRYLLISGSRTEGVPATLQGIWNH